MVATPLLSVAGSNPAGLNFDWAFFWHALVRPNSSFLLGFATTIYISIIAMALAIVVGLLLALGRRSRLWPVRVFVSLYIWVVRGTPLLVQLVIVYDGFSAMRLFSFSDVTVLGIDIQGVVQAGIVTLALNEAAYMAEIIRAGIASVGVGQSEAGLSLGMTPGQVMRRIVLPQAVRLIVPPLGNDFNAMMKSTSLLATIGVSELFLNAEEINSLTFRTFEIYSVAALYYLFLTTVWTLVQSTIEARLQSQLGIPRPPTFRQRLLGTGWRPAGGRVRDSA
ncbi:MAG TPA: amino acid ABC transporter permease [Verrucomicrobiae bacterium]|nr:amino acid ABC transporter permease [Verrucomicrobiae bacterium]